MQLANMRQNKPFLSIITVTYKDREGLRKTLDSLSPLLAEKFSWEHVVVDSSPEINKDTLEALPAEWPLVHIIKEKAEGVYNALNHGITNSNGEILWLLNGGDTLASAEAVRSGLATMEKDPTIQLLYGSASLQREGSYLYTLIPNPDFVQTLLGTNGLCHQSIFYRRGIFDRLGVYSTQYRAASDYDFHWRAYLAGERAKQIPAVLCAYDMSGLSTNFRLTMREFKQIQDKVANKLPPSLRMRNQLGWMREYARLFVVKGLARSFVAPLLRPLWLVWKRR